MKAGALKIYRSSAGSGKTWQLAFNYILFALKPGTKNNFRHILAVTFTNKATREMKDRILQFLQNLAGDDSSELSEKVEKANRMTRAEVKSMAEEVLKDILHNYSLFSVSTIDAFFQKIIRAFARELGLLGNYQLELDRDKVRDKVLDLLLSEAGIDEDLTDWLVDFVNNRVESGEKWDVKKELGKLANEVFTEQFKELETDLQSEGGKRVVLKLLQDLLNFQKTYENTLKQYATEGQRIMASFGLSVGDFKQGSRGPASLFGTLVDKPAYKPNQYMALAVTDPEAWYKNDANASTIREALENGLLEIYVSLNVFIEEQQSLYISVLHFLRHIHAFGLLSDILIKLDHYRRENDVMLISDVNKFLKGIIGENDSPFIYEKTGTWYHHFLIDEFQDTSGFQWENFKPLIENSLAEGYDNLVVGDGKQSIYRWRGGTWELLNHRISEELKGHQIEEINLNINYRSKAAVVNFNNSIFGKLTNILQQLFANMLGESGHGILDYPAINLLLRNMTGLYRDVEQICYHNNGNDIEGYVQVEFSDTEEGMAGWREHILEKIPKKIEWLFDQGFAPCDITILVRNREEGNQIVKRLVDYGKEAGALQFDVISNESLYLGNAHSIQLLLSGLKYLYNPKDQVALANLLYVYYNDREEPGGSRALHKIIGHNDDDPAVPSAIADALHHLKLKSLPDQVEELIRIFGLHQEPQHTAYLIAFQDAVHDFVQNNSNSASMLFDWWEESGQFLSVQVPEDMDAVKVMTIHRSKGLEFNAVLVPFCNWSIDHNTRHENFIWYHPDQQPFNSMRHLPVRYSGKLANTIFRHAYYEERGKAMIDNLNLLYVAFTRAEKALLINCRTPTTEGYGINDIRTVSDLMHYLFYSGKTWHGTDDMPPEIAGAFNPVTGILEYGSIQTPSREAGIHGRHFDRYRSGAWGDRISIKRKARGLFKPGFERRKNRIQYGILVHDVLSRIISIRHVEGELVKLRTEGLLSAPELDILKEQLDRLFANPDVKLWFDQGWEVRTEVPILTGNGREWKPDRILTRGDTAIVIDFKTGAENVMHKTQVRTYRKLLEDMGYSRASSFLLYIESNKVVEVV